MTYNTRQEVLRSAADWMDVCEKAGVVAMCKIDRILQTCESSAFVCSPPSRYEFPLALLEGKNVWVGSELYCKNGSKIVVTGLSSGNLFLANHENGSPGGLYTPGYVSWNPPKPATVMVEMLVEDAKYLADYAGRYESYVSVASSCKKALENL